MIISASRRTDIPAYYSEWFFNRITQRNVLVRNPINAHQISHINLSPDVVDFIVFFSKNPKPMISNLHKLNDYHYYFQFTLNSYGKDIETDVPQKNGELIETFKRLSDKIGPDKVIWRYDPVFLNSKYTIDYHEEYFDRLANQLKDYTEKCTFSFIDCYTKIKKNREALGISELQFSEKIQIAAVLSNIAKRYQLKLDTCAEDIDLSEFSITQTKCVDDVLISQILGCPVKVEKDKNQRTDCRCVASIDIGVYNTCKHGCKYCYANASPSIVQKHTEKYDLNSPLLCSQVNIGDRINERQVKSIKCNQINLFDIKSQTIF